MNLNIVLAVFLCSHLAHASLDGLDHLLANFAVDLVKTQHSVIFACDRKGLLTLTAALQRKNQLIQTVPLTENLLLPDILTPQNHARTSVIVDCECNDSATLFQQVALHHYFNKTYQWLLCDLKNTGIVQLLPHNLDYLGPNAQITYLNDSRDGFLSLWDIHSKGIHLGSPLEMTIVAKWNSSSKNFHFLKSTDFLIQQGIKERDQFNGLRLRGITVIDQDNILTNEQINSILSAPGRSAGVSSFVKYYYHLVCLLRDRLNFTLNFRNSRGWSGYIGNTTYRTGLLGVLARNEADVAATAAFARKSRFVELDTVHLSWKFEAGFLYRFTPDLVTHGKSGNFLAPFNDGVWCFSLAIFFVINFVWCLVEWLKNRWQRRSKSKAAAAKVAELAEQTASILLPKQRKKLQQSRQQQQQVVGSESAAAAAPAATATTAFGDCNCEHSDDGKKSKLDVIWLNIFAAVCQQDMAETSTSLPIRTIILTTFVYTLLMYNFYTSSVVGGLLSSTEQGPETIAEIIESPLKLSFEDLGYNKVLFQESKNPLVKKLHNLKILPQRNAVDLPPFENAVKAVPFIRKGGYAFHCELIDAYPLIQKLFDVEDICDLRKVNGLLETEIVNWPITKRSQYLELFRIVMLRVKEVGLINRNLEIWVSKKPQCQASYRVFPISLSGVLSAFYILLGGYILAVLALFMERKYKKTILNQTN